jgi:hypothetical protein
LRITRVLATLDLPLVKAMAPARLSRPISVMSWPLSPRVMAAITCTLTTALSRARRWMKSTSATWSMTGSVSGITTMVVTPPAAAAGSPSSGLAVLLARLAREHLHVDQAGAQHVALAVDRPWRARARCGADGAEIGDLAVAHQQAAGSSLPEPDRSAAH